MKMSNKVYDFLKWFLITAVAPIIALITGLGELYDFNTTLVLGAILGVSNAQYKHKN